MTQASLKVIALLGSSGFGSGYGHLRRLISLNSVLSSDNYICLHGNFEKTREFLSIVEEGYKLDKCKCDGRPDVVIIDSYDNLLLSNYKYNNIPKLIQLVDELSPKFWADAYIKASPTRDWKPLNNLAKVKEFNNDPILRRDFFSHRSGSPHKNIVANSVLVLIGSSKLSKGILMILSEIFSEELTHIMCAVATNNDELGEFSGSIGFKVVPYLNDFNTLVSNYELVITAGGVTAWELLVLGLNPLILSMADNQDLQLDYLKENFQVNGLKVELNSYFLKTDLKDLILRSLRSSKKKNVPPKPRIHDGAVAAINWLRDLEFV